MATESAFGFVYEYGVNGASVALRLLVKHTSVSEDTARVMRSIADDLGEVNANKAAWADLDYVGRLLCDIPGYYHFSDEVSMALRQLACDIDSVVASYIGKRRLSIMEYRLYDKR
jgi:hypothetical protein